MYCSNGLQMVLAVFLALFSTAVIGLSVWGAVRLPKLAPKVVQLKIFKGHLSQRTFICSALISIGCLLSLYTYLMFAVINTCF